MCDKDCVGCKEYCSVFKNEINVEFTNILNGLINKYAGINSDLGKRIDIIKENFD